jgi:diguanylate cyclase (GGDEF)-like protein
MHVSLSQEGAGFDDTTHPDEDRNGSLASSLGRVLADRRPHLMVMTGSQSGQIVEVGQIGMLLGRGPEADVQLEDESVSRQHARLEPAPDGGLLLFDLSSKNGTRVNGERVSAASLRDGDRVQLGPHLMLKLAYCDRFEAEFHQKLFEATIRDGLTGTFNQRYFGVRLEQEVAFCQRHLTRLSLCLMDVDRFKGINDGHGHQAGDAVLKRVAQAVANAIRVEDVLCRCGGDELAVILRQIDLENASAFADRIRRTVAELEFPVLDRHGQPHALQVTMSLGLAQFDPELHRKPADLVAEADRFLYAAKERGRNRVATRLSDEDARLAAAHVRHSTLG